MKKDFGPEETGHPDGRDGQAPEKGSSPAMDLPSQKDLEREISDYLTKKYGGKVRVVSQMIFPKQLGADNTDETAGDDAHQGSGLNFDLKPEELQAYLDQFVVKQDMAKAILSTKICTHFNRIRYVQKKGKDFHPVGSIKNNIILIGPTGVGKTYLIKLIAARLGVPFVKGDATKFSETGYVGGDVEDLVRDLVQEAGGDIEKAQYGIVYIDEIDKIASSQLTHGLDVSRTGVQRALLKPLEETEVDLRVPHDPISQIEAIERYRKSGKREKQTLNTRHILFIVSGAFSGLGDIIRNRLCKKGIGFGAEVGAHEEKYWLEQVKPQDLIDYGFESEFVGRLPVIGILEQLSEEDLFEILRGPNSVVMLSKKQDFRSYGIDLKFEDGALRLLARQAFEERTGARSLVSAVERALLPFEKRLPTLGVPFLVLTREMVGNPEEGLKRLLENSDDAELLERYQTILEAEKAALAQDIEREEVSRWEEAGMRLTPKRLGMVAHLALTEDMSAQKASERILFCVRQVKSYETTFFNRCGLRITIGDDAVDRLLEESLVDTSSLYTQCERLCNILEYGLTLVKEKTGQDIFNIPAEAVENSELYINRLIRTCYRSSFQGANR
jgi:ATP-dependent Clp protease ATP-binding subunit ClpX